MWKVSYVIGVLFGSTLIMIMLTSWGLSWKQVGIYLLLSWASGTFFRASHDMRRDAKGRQDSDSMKQRT